MHPRLYLHQKNKTFLCIKHTLVIETYRTVQKCIECSSETDFWVTGERMRESDDLEQKETIFFTAGKKAHSLQAPPTFHSTFFIEMNWF